MKEILKLFSLQFFADAGTLVNATGNYVNAYTGDTTSFSGRNTLTPELKDFYDTELLENARAEQFYAQFAKRQPLPANHNGTVEWRKWNTFDRASQLTEGVIPTGQKFGVSNITGSINQYGTYTSITDKLELRAYDDAILGATEEMGASAAETQEALIRDALYAGTNVLYCDKVTLATGAFSAAVTAEKGLVEDGTYGCRITAEAINKAVTKMKKDRVPRINGKYYAVIHPAVAHDLRNDSAWIEAHKYAAPEELFNGEIGELHGMRFIEDVFAPVLVAPDLASDSRTLKVSSNISAGAVTSIGFTGGTVLADELIGRKVYVGDYVFEITDNTDSALTVKSVTTTAQIAANTVIYPGEHAAGGIACYATYCFGKDGFGIIDPEGGGLEMIVHDKDEIGGPLNQFSTIGYKFETNGATILYPERVLRIMSTSYSSTTDEGN